MKERDLPRATPIEYCSKETILFIDGEPYSLSFRTLPE